MGSEDLQGSLRQVHKVPRIVQIFLLEESITGRQYKMAKESQLEFLRTNLIHIIK